MFNKEQIDEVPKESGIYFLYNENKELVYIGKSINLRGRLKQHISNQNYYLKGYWGYSKSAKLFTYFRYSVFKVPEVKLRYVEKEYIHTLNPECNNSSMDDLDEPTQEEKAEHLMWRMAQR